MACSVIGGSAAVPKADHCPYLAQRHQEGPIHQTFQERRAPSPHFRSSFQRSRSETLFVLAAVGYSASDRTRVQAQKIFKFQEDARLQGYRPHIFTAKESDIIGPLAVRLKGRVRIILDGGNVLQADKAEYHLDTGEIDAEGHVRVLIRPEISSRGWSQFGIK